MIQIDEPPDIAACAPCMQPLIWLWSPRRKAWVSFVPGPEADLVRVHGCRKLQDFPTWRDVHTGDPPSAEYIEFREKTKNRTEGIQDMENDLTDSEGGNLDLGGSE